MGKKKIDTGTKWNEDRKNKYSETGRKRKNKGGKFEIVTWSLQAVNQEERMEEEKGLFSYNIKLVW